MYCSMFNGSMINVQCKLEADASLLSKWFVDNHMKLNDAKCHFM